MKKRKRKGNGEEDSAVHEVKERGGDWDGSRRCVERIGGRWGERDEVMFLSYSAHSECQNDLSSCRHHY